MKFCDDPPLRDTVYAQKCIDDRCPFISTVPILIGSGKITAVENKKEYYERVGTCVCVYERECMFVCVCECVSAKRRLFVLKH